MTENDKVVLDSLFKSENINHKKMILFISFQIQMVLLDGYIQRV